MSKKTVEMIDPPYGHKYGFPKIFDIKENEDFSKWLIKNGYPKKLIDKDAHLVCRFWRSEIDENDYKVTKVIDQPYTAKHFAQDLERLFPHEES